MSQVSATLPALGLEAQNLALPANEDTVTQQVETEASDRGVSNSDPLFALGVNVPLLKNYYKRLKRNITISIIVSQLVLLFLIYFIFVECSNLWQWEKGFLSKVSFTGSAFKTIGEKATLWGQIPTSVGFASFLFGNLRSLFRSFQQRRRVCWECDLCKAGRYPTTLTPALGHKFYSLFAWRINGFWIGFTIAGLAIVAAVYTYLCRGFGASGGNKGTHWIVSWSELHKNLFTWPEEGKERAVEKAFRVILGVFVLGLVILITSNVLSRFAIKNALKIFNCNEMNMHPELKEKVFRLNKRDKIISTVLLCVLGLAIFIILKRLIIAVFNRSFNVSKW